MACRSASMQVMPILSKKEGSNHESVQSSTTPDPGLHMGKGQKHKKHNTQKSPEVSPFPAGDHTAARNRHDRHETQMT